jgi:hypothetical protein
MMRRRNTKFHTSDPWIPYKSKGNKTKREMFGKNLEKRELYNFEANGEEEIPQGSKSLHSGRTCVVLRRRV